MGLLSGSDRNDPGAHSEATSTSGTASVELYEPFIDRLRQRRDIDIIKVGVFDDLRIALCEVRSPLLTPGYHGVQQISEHPDGSIKFRKWEDT